MHPGHPLNFYKIWHLLFIDSCVSYKNVFWARFYFLQKFHRLNNWAQVGPDGFQHGEKLSVLLKKPFYRPSTSTCDQGCTRVHVPADPPSNNQLPFLKIPKNNQNIPNNQLFLHLKNIFVAKNDLKITHLELWENVSQRCVSCEANNLQIIVSGNNFARLDMTGISPFRIEGVLTGGATVWKCSWKMLGFYVTANIGDGLVPESST